MAQKSRIEISNVMYAVPVSGWCLYVVFFDRPLHGWFSLTLLCFSLGIFYFCLYRRLMGLLQKIFSGFKAASFIMGIFMTYGAVTGNITLQHAIKLILYYIVPLIVLSLVMCDLGNFKEASLYFLICTVPFAFLISIIGLFRRGRVFTLQKPLRINFWPNFFNNFICLFCIVGGLLVTTEYLYHDMNPTFGFIYLTVFIYIMIPSFIFLTILNNFSVTRKFGLFESFLIILQSVIPGLFIAYFINIFMGKSCFTTR